MSFKGVVLNWMHRYFSDEEAVIFALLLAVFFTALFFFGAIMAPFLTAVVIAYLLQGIVNLLRRLHLPRLLAILLAFSLFIGVLLTVLLWLMPMLWQQTRSLITDLPAMIRTSQIWLNEIPEAYPNLLTQEQLNAMINEASRELRSFGQVLLSMSLSSIPSLLTWLVYLILVPILVFFLLKDKQRLTDYAVSLMPKKRALMTRIWLEIDGQISNYIRGKVLEILIVAAITWVCFAWLGLNYKELLALLIGLTALVPYIGAAVMTLPVALVALFQFGFSNDFLWVLGVYALIQAFEGNVLVPWLFSEAVNLHPVSIIIAILFFGGIWGFWGIFFAIPLATVIRAILNAWPQALQADAQPEDDQAE